MPGLEEAVEQLAREWPGVTLPQEMLAAYRQLETPALPGCLFFSMAEILDGSTRWRGILPDFLPFAEDEDEMVYGLYAVPGQTEPMHVLRWRPESDDYLPVASSFLAFCRWRSLIDAFESVDAEVDSEVDVDWVEEEEDEDEDGEVEELEITPGQIEATLEAVGLSPVADPPLTLEALLGTLLREDPAGVWHLLMTGAIHADRGAWPEAKQVFSAAVDAAPWFADSHFLASIAEEELGNWDASVESLWRGLECTVFLSGNIEDYPLDPSGEESQIHEIARNAILEGVTDGPEEGSRALLHAALASDDWLHAKRRQDLADQLMQAGYEQAAERELLNALALSIDDAEEDVSYDRLVAYYREVGRPEASQRCLADKNRSD
jgi:hypothetical protein